MELLLRNDLAEVERLAAAVEDFCEAQAVPPGVIVHLNLVLEELFVNIVNYAYERETGEGDAGHGAARAREIAVRLERESGGIVVEVIDDGGPFDPLSVPTPDLDASVEDRPIGGLGVHFLRTLMQDLRYHREGGRNHLSFRKILAESDPAS